ncbi:MAG: DUF6788 family protein [Acidimicrobiales bacterium]
MPSRRKDEAPLILKGSLFTFVRRCGKANCACASGEGHASPALSYVEDGRTKTLTLTGADLGEVRAALARHARARAELEAAAVAGIAALRASLAAKRATGR